jgi:hypothetical protein
MDVQKTFIHCALTACDSMGVEFFGLENRPRVVSIEIFANGSALCLAD